MKKRRNYLITLCCMFALGILLVIVGGAMGGNLADASITQDKFEDKAIDKTINDSSDIKNLSVDVEAMDVVLKEGSEFSVKGNGVSKCEVKNGTLNIVSRFQRKFRLFHFIPLSLSLSNIFGDKSDRKITITIPAGRQLSEISLDASAIDFKIDRLSCEKLNINVAAGSIRIDELDSNKADISVSAGDIRVNSFQIRGEGKFECNMGDIRLGNKETRTANLCNRLNADCSMGDVKYYGKLTGETDVDVTMGAISLMLTGAMSQYSFSTDTVLGDINHSDIPTSEKADTVYSTGHLSCTMGDISVSYSEQN